MQTTKKNEQTQETPWLFGERKRRRRGRVGRKERRQGRNKKRKIRVKTKK